MIWLGLLAVVALALFAAYWWRIGRHRWRATKDYWRLLHSPSGEVCRSCLKEPIVGDCWQRREDYPNTSEMGDVGGTYGVAYWCSKHRPDDAVPFRP